MANRIGAKLDLVEPGNGPDGAEAQRVSGSAGSGGKSPSTDALLDGLLLLCRLYDRPATAGELTAGLPLEGGRMTVDLMERAAARVALAVKVKHGQDPGAIIPDLLPALLVMRDGSVCVLTRIGGGEVTLVYPEMESREHQVTLDELRARHDGTVAYAAPVTRQDQRAGAAGAEPHRHWFWGELGRFKWSFAEIAAAAALANVLALATALFSRQVYDRVVPNLAFSTLWVLTIGVGLAIAIEVMVRITRGYLMDVTGKRLDMELSSRLFERAMGMQLNVRPASTGSFVNQVREFDAIREFFTSTTIGAISDLPFAFLFIGVIALIGGPVALVLVAAIPLIVIPGLVAQWPLAHLSRRHMREGSIRNGLLVEAMTGAETVKALHGEGRFQRLWEEYTGLLAVNGTHTRNVSNMLTYWSAGIQQASYVMVMVVSVYQISKGELTMGGMLACSILSSRSIAPLTQLAGILGRWQQMRAAMAGIDAIMNAPVDRPVERKFVHRPRLKGDFELENVSFRYAEEGDPVLQIPKLSLEAGSATALLGTNGSGKSTLLKILAGLYPPTQGSLLLDGTDMRQIDPTDLRRSIAYLPQETRLFYGTLRDNLLLGLEQREDEELLEALAFVGADSLVREHPMGLDLPIGESGSGVSGGQRQSIGLARLWLRDPRIVLLDEPTAAIDQALEMKVINNMKEWAAGRTVILATHRQPVLTLVERAIVIKRGRLAADGPLEGVLAALSSNNNAAKSQRPPHAQG